MQLTGIHHLTAISAHAKGNLAFYTGVLGYAAGEENRQSGRCQRISPILRGRKGEPRHGSDLLRLARGARASRHPSVSRTGLRVNGEKALGFWQDRLLKLGVHTGKVTEVDGRLTLPFEDPEGQRLVLVDDGGKGDAHPWEKSPVTAEHQIRGLGPIVLNVPDLARTERALVEVMNMKRVRDYASPDGEHRINVYEMGAGGPAAELHVLEQKDLPPARQGAGGVHHVAFRTPDEASYHEWTRRLSEFGLNRSGEIDRFYFRSLYFREPNGILVRDRNRWSGLRDRRSNGNAWRKAGVAAIP